MKPRGECATCGLGWVFQRATIESNHEERLFVMEELLKVFALEFRGNKILGSICNKAFEPIQEIIERVDPGYQKLRAQSNQYVQSLLPKAKMFIEKGKTPRERIERACYLASAGNVAPIGLPSEGLKFAELEQILSRGEPLPVLKGDVYHALEVAKRILYVCDNSGEIGLDSLLIARLKEWGKEVCLVVRDPPLFEDATKEDASFFGIDTLVDEILTVKGLFVPGANEPILDAAFQRSDLLISKGTGNFEGVKGHTGEKATICMLKVKCGPVAEETGVEIGKFVVMLEK